MLHCISWFLTSERFEYLVYVLYYYCEMVLSPIIHIWCDLSGLSIPSQKNNTIDDDDD